MLGLSTLNAMGLILIPGQGTKLMQTVRYGQKKNLEFYITFIFVLLNRYGLLNACPC